MRKVATLALLMMAVLTASAWANESWNIWSLPGEQAPAAPQEPETPPEPAPAQAPAGGLMQSLQGQPVQGGYPQVWQQPPQWPMHQPWGGQYPPRYAPGGQAPYYPQPQAPAYPQPQPAATADPRDEELSRLREQVIEQEDELNRANEILATQYAQLNEAYAQIELMRRGEIEVQEARAQIEQMRMTEAELQEAHSRIQQLHTELDAQSARATEQTDKIDYLTRMQNALRAQITETVESQRAKDAMLEQQQQLISSYEVQNRQLKEGRDHLRSALIKLNEKMNALQTEVLRALSDTLQNTQNTP
jgi:hypothetical protein